ncbi:hypothetical protein [Longimycelium tulufanense]|nr:hypothetical protein [Longimycelium tulufanense]
MVSWLSATPLRPLTMMCWLATIWVHRPDMFGERVRRGLDLPG